MFLQPVILSGGAGTRLWPLSRATYPKQFLPLGGSSTMLQDTITRLDGLVSEHPNVSLRVKPPLVVCNEDHRFLVAEQLQNLNRLAGATILIEPVARDTAPALTLAALQATQNSQNPLLLVMPADHLIKRPAEFRRLLALGCTHIQPEQVVTFGIVPTEPETGYGYIRGGLARTDCKEIFALEEFREKPDINTAKAFVANGQYYWNSGIFLLHAQFWLQLIQKLEPELAGVCTQAFAHQSLDRDFVRIDSNIFSTCPSKSIDYAVMEHLAKDQAQLILMQAEWSDLGSWSSIWQTRAQDQHGNSVEGDVYTHNATGNLLIAQHRMLAAVGIDDTVIVETKDAVLVIDKSQTQNVKLVTQYLAANNRSELKQLPRCHRPWGSYETIDIGNRYQVKRLTVTPGASLSLQLHYHRAEHWVVVSGTAKVTKDQEVFLLTENQSTYIPLGVKHRLENPGHIPLEIIEVQSGSYLGEDDIVRFEDLYARVPTGSQSK
ncbi:mannose-1-phosphate guanyltransferase [Achromatium sp. WMS2]|nr:mannose-1-phosphate guanyltransferase [Achromatium sp. WMS2]